MRVLDTASRPPPPRTRSPPHRHVPHVSSAHPVTAHGTFDAQARPQHAGHGPVHALRRAQEPAAPTEDVRTGSHNGRARCIEAHGALQPLPDRPQGLLVHHHLDRIAPLHGTQGVPRVRDERVCTLRAVSQTQTLVEVDRA